MLIAAAYFLSPFSESERVGQPGRKSPEAKKLKRVLLFTTGLIYFQLFLGASIRHTGKMVVPHILIAILVLAHVLLVVSRMTASYEPGHYLNRISRVLGGVTMMQLVLGLGSLILTKMVERSCKIVCNNCGNKIDCSDMI